ncbi:alpha/beta hydrolase family esterase [Brevundimonas goettingensis]|uniref:Prolyl oligopeptidase family serine peptidase n=1 Tax=Brevundimonas goettingensis TaxID=2774190 RepID=A0A975GVG1_9CAUL|nr:PHB depolymerase family esterase [Brevundimonas goettingensis]QTC91377.1 prolyl oligopeptidase family serine peptidase [Brevundimonas goettingensis]
MLTILPRPVLALAAVVFALAGSQAAEAACGAGAPGRTERVEIGDTGRSLLLHRPAAQDGSTPLPLVILLHGSTMTGAQMLSATTLEATAEAKGFIVAAPDAGIPAGPGFVWNIPGVPTVTGKVPGPEDADDVAYLGAVIDDLVARQCIDRARVYVTGLSGGGRMASWLGCVTPERFAAIAPVVGLRAGNPDPDDASRPDPKTCTPSLPVPVMAFAGDADRTNPIQGGGLPYWSYSMHAAEQRWAQLNGCTAAPTATWIADGVYEERHGGCTGDAEVIGRITVGGGHVWLADEAAMWAFFSSRTRS